MCQKDEERELRVPWLARLLELEEWWRPPSASLRLKKTHAAVSGAPRHHKAMRSLFTAWYNFGRKHEALGKQTPAMASGLSDHVWSVKELIEKAAEA